MTGTAPRVIVCQIGAREHYAIPRTLHRAGLLEELVTDIWAPPRSGLGRFPGRIGERLRGRYHPDLSSAQVTHFTGSALGREAISTLSRPRKRWDVIVAQNRWFQAKTIRHLRAHEAFSGPGDKPIVLAYSYAARGILSFARDHGARTILAQIDGGKADEALISQLWSAQAKTMTNKAPDAYWDAWREECEIADEILVNSEWSCELLVRAGVDRRKLTVVPVTYERPRPATLTVRQYPKAFDRARPLKVLFLGAKTLRKGVLEAIGAARELSNQPVQFTFVGEDTEKLGGVVASQGNVIWRPSVPRSWVSQFYDDADLFLFPTHSDGFGMTQIEALESGLPVIASRNCATVVQHGRTGLLLEEVSTEAIVRAVSYCLLHPERLASMSAAALLAAQDIARNSAANFLDAIDDFGTRERR